MKIRSENFNTHLKRQPLEQEKISKMIEDGKITKLSISVNNEEDKN